MNGALNLKADTVDPRAESAALKAAIWRELDIGNGPPPDGTPVKPSDYTAAGYSYVYRQCSNYFDALIKYQNETHFASDIVVAGGSTAGTIMGLLKTSSQAIGAVAAGVGFANAALNSFDNRALITPYPNETKTLILSALDKYRETVPPEKVTTATSALVNVEHFAELCTYSGITRAAKQALSNYKGDVIKSQNAETATLVSAISSKLGLTDPALSDLEVITLYWFIYDAGSPCTDINLCNKALTLVPRLKKILANVDNSLKDLSSVKGDIGDALSQLYANDTFFKTQVDNFGAQLKSPPASTDDGKPKPSDAGTQQTTGATTVVPLADLSKSRNLAATPTDASANVENFAHFDFSKQQDPSTPTKPTPTIDPNKK
jgi:hypothetical protein